MEDSFDPSPYTRLPQMPVGMIIALATQLDAAALRGAPPPVNRAARRMRQRCTELKAQWDARDTAQRTRDPRPIDLRNDRLWGAVFRRLDAFDGLDPADVPDAPRALEIRDALFPQGLGFLTYEYPVQWAEGEKRLSRVDADGALARDLTALVGARVVAALRESHAAYGAMLGMTASRRDAESASVPNLTRPLRALADAITAYAIQLVAMRQDDPSTADAVARALAPVDEMRTRTARTDPKSAQPDEPPPPPSPGGPTPGGPAGGVASGAATEPGR